ncbi:MAG: DNA-directed RNA polymerase subunit beta', partial [bacterium]
ETILVPPHRTTIIHKGDEIVPGQALTDGYQNPLDLLKIMGVHQAAQYIINMIQSVYRSQGVSLNDKHFEVILSQMLKFVEIVDRGDSSFQEHSLVSRMEFMKETEKLKGEGKRLPAAAPALVGVKRAAILSPSFLSAASFQETARVLTTAALEGRRDYLHGLKENIIIGKEIPAGTGFPLFQTIRYKISTSTPPQPTEEGRDTG